MLKVIIPSFETYRIGTRPAVLASLKKMLHYFDIDVNQKIFFNNEAEVSKLLGGEGTDKRGADLDTDLGYDNKLFVEMEKELAGYNDELDGNSNDDVVPCVWFEPMTGSKITPKFSTRRFEITVNAFFKDRVTAERYYANIRSKTFGMNQNTEFAVETHYPTTYPQLQCFKEIFDRLVTAGRLPADKNFIDWMIENSVVPAGILRNPAFKNPVFVFKQRIEKVGVNMNNPRMAFVNKGAFIGKYEVSFSYWFFWSEHVEWIMKYPIQIYQQPMPPEYLPEVFEDNLEDYPLRRFFEAQVSSLVYDYEKNKSPFYHILPNIDNWRPTPTYWISPQLQVMINVEDVEEQVLLNIQDIQGFEWNPLVIYYIMKYRTKVTRRHHNPMNFKLYSNDVEVLETQIELRENGDLVLTRPPRMENTYRLVFSFDYALRLYSDDCIEDMLNDPEYGKWIIGILFPNYPLPDNWGDNGLIDWWDVHNGIEVGDGDEVHPWFPYGMLGSLIIAHNKDDYQKYLSLKNKGVIDGTDYYRYGQSSSTGTGSSS